MELCELQNLILNRVKASSRIPSGGCIIISGNDLNDIKIRLQFKERIDIDVDILNTYFGQFKIYYSPKIEDGKPEIYFSYE